MAPIRLLVFLFFMIPTKTLWSLYTNGIAPDRVYVHLGQDAPMVAYAEVRDPNDKTKASGFTATLIAPDILITTAHSVVKYMAKGPGPHPLTGAAYFDPFVRINGSVPHVFKRAIIHPKYTQSTDYDVALIQLQKPVTDINPAPLYAVTDPCAGRENKHLLKRFPAVVYGYGRTVNGPSDGARRGAIFPSIVPMAGRHLMVGFYPSPPDDQEMHSIIGRSNGQFQLIHLPILREKAKEFQGVTYGLLAPGDSGGPLFTLLGGVRVIVGLNKNATCHSSVQERDSRNRPLFKHPEDGKKLYFLCHSGFSYLFDPKTGLADQSIGPMIDRLRQE